MTKPLQDQVCLVTGATSGIGLITARELARLGAKVVITARDPKRGEGALAQIAEAGGPRAEVLACDLASPASIRAAAAEFRTRYGALQVLVNNAGALNARREVTPDGFERTFAVNHLAYFLMTHLLLDLLKANTPGRIVNVASEAHRLGWLRFDDLNWEKRPYNGLLAYATTKLQNLLFTAELARRLHGSGVTCNAVHPGVVASRFAERQGILGLFYRATGPLLLSPERGARCTLFAATAPELEHHSGEYFVRCRVRKQSGTARNPALQRQLWEESERLLGLAADEQASAPVAATG